MKKKALFINGRLLSVSEDGDVASFAFKSDDGRNFNGRKLSPFNNGHGYLQVAVGGAKDRKNYYVHRLVAMAFSDEFKPDLEVDHIDGNRSHNHINNLRVCSTSGNRRGINRRNSKLGLRGIYERSDCNRYEVVLLNRVVGYADSVDAAKRMWNMAAQSNGFHQSAMHTT